MRCCQALFLNIYSPGGEDVVISGRAVERASGQALPEVPLNGVETRRYVTLTDDSLHCLESSGIHPDVLRYIGQLKDEKFASEDKLIEALKAVLTTGYVDEYEPLILGCAEWGEDETLSGGAFAHYLNIHDPQTLAVLTAQSFERLRQEDSIPENLLACLEVEFLDRKISIPWHQNELIRRVEAYLQTGCGLGDYEQGNIMLMLPGKPRGLGRSTNTAIVKMAFRICCTGDMSMMAKRTPIPIMCSFSTGCIRPPVMRHTGYRLWAGNLFMRQTGRWYS